MSQILLKCNQKYRKYADKLNKANILRIELKKYVNRENIEKQNM